MVGRNDPEPADEMDPENDRAAAHTAMKATTAAAAAWMSGRG